MFIKEIELKNITTHKDTKIEFLPGINVLAGDNGTGKSTVLNMIGFVLFNSIDRKQSDYIRNENNNKINQGKVKIILSGLDGDDYSIERSIGKSMINVVNLFTNTKLNFKDRNDYFKWVKDNLGIIEDIDLKTIFENAIGVHQGTFIVPFELPPQRRKDFFYPLLNVDIYEKAYKRYSEINNAFTKEYTELEIQISSFEGQLKEYNALLKEKDEYDKEIIKFKAEQEKSQKDYKKISFTFEKLKEIKDNLEKASEEYKSTKVSVENLKNSLGDTEKLIKKAKEAKAICDTNKKPYEKYKKLQVDEKLLTKQEKEFHSLQKDYDKQVNKLEKLNIEINSYQETITKIKKIQEKFPELKSKHTRYQLMEKKIGIVQEKLAVVNSNKKQLDIKIKKLRKTQIEKNKLEEKLQDLPVLKESISKIEKNQEKILSIERKIASLDTERSQYLKNKSDSEGGLCPFLHEKCKNITNDSLEVHFQDKIDILEEDLTSFRSTLRKLKLELEKLQIDKDSYDRLKNDEIRVKQLGEQFEEIKKEVQDLRKSVLDFSTLQEKLHEVTTEKNQLHEYEKEYTIQHEKIFKVLPEEEKALKKRQKGVQPLEEQISVLSKDLEKLKDVPIKLQNLRDDLEKCKEGNDLYISNVKIMKTLPNLEKERQTKLKEIEKFKNDLQEKQVILQKLEIQFNIAEFEEISTKREKLSESLIRLQEKFQFIEETQQKIQQKILKLEKVKKSMKGIEKEKDELDEIMAFSGIVRSIYKESGPKITEALLNNINGLASEIFRDLSDQDAVSIEWLPDFDVKIITSLNERYFHQLSGGEQMAAALAIRLAVLQTLTDVDFAFFDEPTTNLDVETRQNLAKSIQKLSNFQQIFVISHDDTFEENSDNIIRFTKNEDQETCVEFESIE
jgi:DNA repair protein SbcC/Rad50